MDGAQTLDGEILRHERDGYRLRERTATSATLIRSNWSWWSFGGLVGLIVGTLGATPTRESRVDLWIDDDGAPRSRYS